MNKIGWTFALIVLAGFIWLAFYSWNREKELETSYSPEAIHRVNDLAVGKKIKWTTAEKRAALIQLGWGRP